MNSKLCLPVHPSDCVSVCLSVPSFSPSLCQQDTMPQLVASLRGLVLAKARWDRESWGRRGRRGGEGGGTVLQGEFSAPYWTRGCASAIWWLLITASKAACGLEIRNLHHPTSHSTSNTHTYTHKHTNRLMFTGQFRL